MLAPGAPGIDPTWTTSDKSLVGSALGNARVWYTLGHGIVNEVYYPRADIPQIRDLGFIVAGENGFWVEVKRMLNPGTVLTQPGIPAAKISHVHEQFSLFLTICIDPDRDVLLIKTELVSERDLRLYVLLAPHLGGTGYNNHAWAGMHNGQKVLWAEQGPFGLALLASNSNQEDAYGETSAGYVGVSDGWQDFARNRRMTWQWDEAGPGNVALMGRIDGQSVLALGFGGSKGSAATLARAALIQSFDKVLIEYEDGWRRWHNQLNYMHGIENLPDEIRQQFSVSAMVLKTHMDHVYPGAMVASLSIPWGQIRNERGGYHLVWPRDLVECAGALLNIGAVKEARDILRYLIASQQADGHWFQNQWLGGNSFWNGIQLDETAFPVLLAAYLAEREMLGDINVTDMVRRALGYLIQHGPSSEQDRWEEQAGFNTFTLAACIAALVAGSRFLGSDTADYTLAIADYWNSKLEDWTLLRHTRLSKKYEVNAYYTRVAPASKISDTDAVSPVFPVCNSADNAGISVEEQIGTDFLQLVRFGLRSADDESITDSLRIIDRLLKVETSYGPVWKRYNGDGYGEKEDGSAYDGSGHGRAWPLLTGERGHYELAAGRDAFLYLRTMCESATGIGMLPEQVWDEQDMPEHNLFFGQPTGSAMPLAWTNAEFIKLVLSVQEKRIVDRPESVWDRYHGKRPETNLAHWTPAAAVTQIKPGQDLMIWLPKPANIHFTFDNWVNIENKVTADTGLGMHAATLVTHALCSGTQICFTWKNISTNDWAGKNYSLKII